MVESIPIFWSPEVLTFVVMSARMVQRALRNHDVGSSALTDLGRSESDDDHAQESSVTNRFDLLGLQVRTLTLCIVF